LALVIEGDGTLIAGDHLSPCEIPFVEDLDAYVATLKRLLALLGGVVRSVVPGHGPVLDAADARVIAAADLAYLERLVELRDRGGEIDPASVELPRAREVPGMLEHHADNCRKARRA
jgi:glyoxylase-like metal-dependent hydrolase (beta-lactamase superfamily II)